MMKTFHRNQNKVLRNWDKSVKVSILFYIHRALSVVLFLALSKEISRCQHPIMWQLSADSSFKLCQQIFKIAQISLVYPESLNFFKHAKNTKYWFSNLWIWLRFWGFQDSKTDLHGKINYHMFIHASLGFGQRYESTLKIINVVPLW